jgi:hypothetical protein
VITVIPSPAEAAQGTACVPVTAARREWLKSRCRRTNQPAPPNLNPDLARGYLAGLAGAAAVIAAAGALVAASAGGWAGPVSGTDVAGTRFAAPWVAGLAALLRERSRKLTAAQIVDRILATARRPAGGRSALQLGRGVIDPVAALGAVPTC